MTTNPWIRVALGTAASIVLAIALAFLFLIGGDASKAAGDSQVIVTDDMTTSAPTTQQSDTTAPARAESVLTVSSPAVGDVITSPLRIVGASSQPEIEYRLLGGGQLLAAGALADNTIEIAGDGTFTATVPFTNTCCIEMTLELFHQKPDGSQGLLVSIPLTYPEPTPTETEEPNAATSVAAIAQQFLDAINSRNVAAVADFAPTISAATLDFLIGGGPYETLDCYQYEGKDECHIVHGIADFTFVVDVDSGVVPEVIYVGGS